MFQNSKWQPIKTAPKDGTPVLLYSPIPQDYIGKGGNTPRGLIWISGGWRDTGGWRGDYCKDTPTYWMLLPEPPKEM